jgi:preprotein translocase subunit SecG
MKIAYLSKERTMSDDHRVRESFFFQASHAASVLQEFVVVPAVAWFFVSLFFQFHSIVGRVWMLRIPF